MKFRPYYLAFGLLAFACNSKTESKEEKAETVMDHFDSLAADRISKYSEVTLSADLSTLKPYERKMLPLLIKAAQIMDDLFWQQTYGNKDSLFLKGAIADFQVSDSLNFPSTNLSITSSHDLSNIQVKTRASSTLNEADLNAKLETSPNGIKINFNPSSLLAMAASSSNEAPAQKTFSPADCSTITLVSLLMPSLCTSCASVSRILPGKELLCG